MNYPSMLRRVFSEKIGISPKLVAKNLVLVASAFVWYFLAYRFIENAANLYFPKYTIEILGANIGGLAVSALIGSLITDRFRKRDSFVSFWMAAGVFLSLLPLFSPFSSLGEIIAVSTIFGVYFGVGMPVAMGYFAASSTSGNRGTIAGVTFLTIGMSFFVLGNIGTESPSETGIILAGVRLTGLILFLFLGGKDGTDLTQEKPAYRQVLRDRTFILYFVPWIMFNVVNYLTIPVTIKIFPLEFVHISGVFENILIAVFAIVTGFLIDIKGRKRLAILGFALLGLGYASLGFFPDIYGWYVYTVADGIAWGILDVIFLFTLWGDIAKGRNSEKFYAMGALPYLFSNFMVPLFTPLMTNILPISIFTFASFFLFLAVLPLVYAPETLPEKVMKEKELKFYVAKAQEIAQKYY